MSNKAKDVIIPSSSGVFRIVFLYVGQGDSTLLVIPDGSSYKYVLIDSNHGASAGGIDLVKMFKDLFAESDDLLHVYMNTHPHKDHVGKVKELYDEIGMNELWHSGHKPGKDHDEAYKDLQYVIKKLGEDKVRLLKGSNDDNKIDDEIIKIGDVNYTILAPAEYVVDDIEDEKSEDRYKRIHEQCGVLQFKYGSSEKQVLVSGDADYVAWKNYITKYHKIKLPSTVLRSSHHGSNSFFWEGDTEKEDAYTEHLDSINPEHIIVSAPKKSESRHNHPDDKAMDIYRNKVGKDNVYHLGKNRECVIVDITDDGSLDLTVDKTLVKSYGITSDDEKSSQNNDISYEKPRKAPVMFPTRYG